MATSALTVITLRSRLDRPGRSHISPNRTFSVRSTSFGATSPILSLAVGSGLSFVIDSPDVHYLPGPRRPLPKMYHYQNTREILASLVGHSLIWKFPPGGLGPHSDNPCQLNRSMQHHLIG